MKDEIYIGIEIGEPGITVGYVVKRLNVIRTDIKIIINSFGGDCFEGLAIYNAIKNYKGKTTAYIESVAYGVASIIALACDEIYMKKGAYFVISEPTIQTVGNGKDMEKAMSELDIARDTMTDIYMEKPKKTKEEIFKMMEQETWLTDKGAEIDGFVDFVYD